MTVALKHQFTATRKQEGVGRGGGRKGGVGGRRRKKKGVWGKAGDCLLKGIDSLLSQCYKRTEMNTVDSKVGGYQLSAVPLRAASDALK